MEKGSSFEAKVTLTDLVVSDFLPKLSNQILFVLHECKGTKCKMTGPRILFSFSNVTVSTERTLMIS